MHLNSLLAVECIELHKGLLNLYRNVFRYIFFLKWTLRILKKKSKVPGFIWLVWFFFKAQSELNWVLPTSNLL